MIHHVVMIRLMGGMPDEDVEQFCDQATEILSAIPGVRNFVIGRNIRDDDHPLALLMDFADEDALQAYQVHPEHRRFLSEVIGPIVADKKVVDYRVG